MYKTYVLSQTIKTNLIVKLLIFKCLFQCLSVTNSCMFIKQYKYVKYLNIKLKQYKALVVLFFSVMEIIKRKLNKYSMCVC